MKYSNNIKVSQLNQSTKHMKKSNDKWENTGWMPILKYSETQTNDSQFCSAEAHSRDGFGSYESSTNNHGS